MVLYTGIISETGEPVHSMFFSKPGYLALSVAARFKLCGFERLFRRERSIHQLQSLLVAEGLERFG